jgi:hypothetical protein
MVSFRDVFAALGDDLDHAVLVESTSLSCINIVEGFLRARRPPGRTMGPS